MTWTYRAPHCSFCRRMAVTVTEAGYPVCAYHSAQVDDGQTYQERADQLYARFTALYDPAQADAVYYVAIPDPMALTWRQIAERLAELLPATVKED